MDRLYSSLNAAIGKGLAPLVANTRRLFILGANAAIGKGLAPLANTRRFFMWKGSQCRRILIMVNNQNLDKT